MTDPDADRRRAGILYALSAYAFWGVVPVYWKALGATPALVVLAHRVIWSVLFVGLLLTWQKGWIGVRAALSRRRTLLLLAATTTLITVNWGLFIWAVKSGHLLEASLGYFINPLVNVVLGVALLRERLRPLQMIAVALAACGVIHLTIATGVLPWISLVLAGTFALYGYVRKVAPIEALEGLFVETAIGLPVAGWYLATRSAGGAPGTDGASLWLLAAAGPITALPLLWFGRAAQRLPLSTLGFFQYIAPSCQFLLAAFAYGEPVTRKHVVTFALIWTALAIYTTESRWAARRARLAR
jgi:chloramphenicol-sensitive protein RarD